MIATLYLVAICILLICCLIAFLAGRSIGFTAGWDANSRWQHGVSENGLKPGEVIPMSRVKPSEGLGKGFEGERKPL